MKKLLIPALLCFCTTLPTAAQGINFVEKPVWTNVLKMATEQDKLIFMDCYTTWCAPCKRLAEEIFPLPEVGDYFNANFVNVQYDMEKDEGKELYERYKSYIVGFPTMLLIDKNGEVVHQMAGFKDPDVLIAGVKAGTEGGSLMAMRARYEMGERDVDFMINYVATLGAAFLTKEVEEVVTNFMESLPLDSLFSQKNWTLVGSHIKKPYSPQFEHVLKNTTKLIFRLKVDGYQLERQLSGALERAVDEITGLQTDRGGNILPLNADRDKINRLKELINIANMKRAETQRAFLAIHELRLDEQWQEALNSISHYTQVRALGYSNRFANETIQYIASKTSDEVILRQCLAMVEHFQAIEDRSERGASYHNTLATLYRALGDNEKAEKSQAISNARREKAAAEWNAMMGRINDPEE